MAARSKRVDADRVDLSMLSARIYEMNMKLTGKASISTPDTMKSAADMKTGVAAEALAYCREIRTGSQAGP